MPHKSKPSRTGKSRGLETATVAALSDLEHITAQIDAAKRMYSADVLHARPKSSFTVREYAVRHKLPLTTASQQIRLMVTRGILTVQKAMVVNPYGRCGPTQVYSLKKK